MKSQTKFLLGMVTVLMLIVQSIQPIPVYADGETTLPPEETVVDTPTPEPIDIPETTLTPVPAEPTAELVETEAPVPSIDSTEAPTEPAEVIQSMPETVEPAAPDEAVEEPTLAEILQEIPEGTDIVALDENGEPEPLATQEAAEIIATGDPIWCPDGVAPTPGANGCTGSFDALWYLIHDFVPTGNGTIWIQSGPDTGGEVSIDGAAPWPYGWSAASNYSLTLQGGWSGVSGDTGTGSNSIFTVPISITNWNGNLTVNNITINGASGSDTGLTVSNSSAVTINDSTFSGMGLSFHSGYGAHISDVDTVTINNSTFSGNGGWGTYTGNGAGVVIDAVNNLTISDSSFNGNGQNGSSDGSGTGAFISDAGNVTILGSSFSGNGGDGSDHGTGHGVFISEAGNVTISNNTFTGNGGDGSSFAYGTGVSISEAGDVTILNSAFTGNGGYESGSGFYNGGGVQIDQANNIVISSSSFNGNYDSGVTIFSNNSTSISDSSFNGNNGEGAFIESYNTTISNSTFNGNDQSGLIIGNGNTGNTSISSSSFSGNYFTGLLVNGPYSGVNNVEIENSIFSENQIGIETDTTSMYVDGAIYVSLNCVQFSNNEQDILLSEDVTVTDNPCFQPPPPDRDHDGIIDDEDACPDIPGVRTDDPLTNGCPVQPQLIVVEGHSISFPIDCSLFSSYIPVWPNGDRVLISCVPNGMAVVSRVENTDLTDELGAGYEYASGLNVEIFQAGARLSTMPENGKIQVSFAAGESDARYGIMYWDESAGEWVLFEEYQLTPSGAQIAVPLSDAEDFRTILAGAQFTVGNPNRESVSTNFLGTYLLVVQK